jgi:hypothetical protein
MSPDTQVPQDVSYWHKVVAATKTSSFTSAALLTHRSTDPPSHGRCLLTTMFLEPTKWRGTWAKHVMCSHTWVDSRVHTTWNSTVSAEHLGIFYGHIKGYFLRNGIMDPGISRM